MAKQSKTGTSKLEDAGLELSYTPLEVPWLQDLLEIEREAYPDPWSENMFRQEMLNGAAEFFLAFSGERMVGYAGFWLLLDEAHITKVTVERTFRGQGLGRALMQELLRRAAEMGAVRIRLEVRTGNDAARALYNQLGFSEVRTRKGYYARTGEDAIEMCLLFSEEQDET